MKKKISAAIFYTDKIKFLIVHPTRKNFWEIPKGEIDEGELADDTAIREFKEETSITIYRSNLLYIGTFPLHEHKDIVLFAYVVNELPNINTFKCKSTTTAYGSPVPELDEFQYIPLMEFHKIRQGLHTGIRNAIQKVNNVYK